MNRINETFSDEELDMDEDAWLEQMKAQRAEALKNRQAKRDADAKAQAELEAKKAEEERIHSLGQITEEEKKRNINHNKHLLFSYIKGGLAESIMESAMEAINSNNVHSGNELGYEPWELNHTDFSVALFYIYMNFDSPYNQDEMRDRIQSPCVYSDYKHVLEFCGLCCWDDLDITYMSGHTECRNFTSGEFNTDDWKAAFHEGTLVLKDENDVHDYFDSDAELYAAVKWGVWEDLGVMVTAATIQDAKDDGGDIYTAISYFCDSPYAQGYGSDNAWLFQEYCYGLIPDEEAQNLKV